MINVEKREFKVVDEYVYNRAGPVRWILSHLWRHKLFVLSFFSAVFTLNLTNVWVPKLTGQAFDAVLGKAGGRSLLTVALLILGAVLLRGVLDIVSSYSCEVMGKRLTRDAREELYLSLLGKSQTFHNRQRVGDVMARATSDVGTLSDMIVPGVQLIADSFLSLILPIIFIGFLRVELLLTPLLFTVAFLIALRHYMNQLSPVSDAMRMHYGNMNATLTESVVGIEVVKSAVQEAQELRKFKHSARLYRDFFVKQGQVQAFYLPQLLIGIALAGAFLHGLVLYLRGGFTIGDLVAYMGLMGLLRFPTFISIFTFSLVQMGIASAERILELMNQESDLDENSRGNRATLRGDIRFENVTFSYDGHVVLKNVSFHAKPGQTIAIVGQTGSGKSTLTKLVNRTYDADEGRILIDGIDVRQWSMDSLRSQISTIEQNVFLFSRTVAQNIAFGLGQKADPVAIEGAAREAQAHDFIMHFADGYGTEIGERGVTLSGGQRQRLAIARALLSEPRILILDDSTSAIDSATEDEIQKAILRVLEGRTTLLITHRLSQIRWADHVLVLKQGEVIDQGKHEELLERCDLYRRIFARYG
ncbi:MAG: ABC transporter ATP-binding protein [Caldilineaceae bacterium]